MADAPASGGGNAWTAIEIILVLVLIIAAVSKITGTPITPIFDSSSQKTIERSGDNSTPTKRADCGLGIQSPQSGDTVIDSVTLSGSVAGCNWYPSEGIALHAEVIDQNGTPLSQYTNVPVGMVNSSVAKFSTSIPLSTTPSTPAGVLILIPADSRVTPDGTVSVRIPLKFAHQ